MSKKITNVSYSWEKSSVKLNASEVDDERKEKWEKILGNKVFEMVKEENPSLLLFTKDNCFFIAYLKMLIFRISIEKK